MSTQTGETKSMTNIQRDWRQFALLLIDVQRDFWTETMAQSFPDFPTNIVELLDLCRMEGIDVVHLRASFKPDMSDWMLKYKLLGRIPCIQGTPGIATLPFALEKPDEIIITKQTFDGFLNPQLLQHLRQKGKRFVFVAGLITSTCVLFTATTAAQSGFLAALVDDCCADEPAAHEYTLSQYGFIFSRTTVDMITDNYDEWLTAINKLDDLNAKQRKNGTHDKF